MARKNVVEITCDRCERVEYINPDEHAELPALVVQFGAQTAKVQPAQALNKNSYEPEISAKFGELCSSCKKSVRNLIEQATRKINWRRTRTEDGLELEVEPEAKEKPAGGSPKQP